MVREINSGRWVWALLLVWLVGWAGGVYAQNRPAQFEFRHIQEKDGLGFNIINCFLQDRDGFLWIGTFDGLNRYDGDQFVIFKHNEADAHSLLHNTVNDLCEDRQGNIWMAVANGISCYDKKTGRFRNYTAFNRRALGICNNILCDRNGDIWFTSYLTGLHRYVARTGQVQYFPYNPQTASSFIARKGLVQDPLRNGLWIADGHGLQYFDKDRQQFTNHTNNPQRLPIFTNHDVSALALDGDRLIYADNTARTIVFYSLSQQRVLHTVTPVSRQSNRDVFDIATIFVDRQHNLWTSSWNYVMFHIAANTYQTTELLHDDAQPTSIAGRFFWAGWQHPDGSVWLGTVNGISYTNPSRAFYSVYDIQKLFPALTDREGITQLLEDEDGTWWLGTHVRGLLHYNPQTNQLKVHKLPDAPNQFPYGGYVAAIVPYERALFIGSNIGFSRFDKKTQRAQKIPFPAIWKPVPASGKPVSLRCAVRYSNRIWIGNNAGQVFSYTPSTGQWQLYPIRALSDHSRLDVTKLLIDAHNKLWAHVAPEGFAHFDESTAQFLVDKPADHTKYNPVAASAMQIGNFDQAGNIWLSANGFGLWRYNPRLRRFDNWTESDGLAYDRALSAMPDNLGNIWVGAYNQFSIFKPARHHFLNVKLPLNETNLEYADQMYRLQNGHILTALKGHLVEFFPEKIAQQTATLPKSVLISQVSNGDSIWLNHSGLERAHFNAEETSFAIHFGALMSFPQTPFHYVYKLEGYDDWKQAHKSTDVVYTNMPGGDYTFKVKAVAADGRETPVSQLIIHRDAHFYQTIWFRGLVFLLVLSLVVSFIRYRTTQTAQLHNLQVQATRLERDKTEIQYQNLINHLNPHFLFNSLTSLNSLIITSPKEASLFLKKLSVIYRYILQNKDKELVSLQEELAFVQHYIDLQDTRFGESLQVSITIDPVYLSQRIVPVTIQNLLENAIKHNIISDDTPLYIQIYTENATLYVANDLQKKGFVETSNKQGLASLKSLYHYLSRREVSVTETDTIFIVAIPLL